MNITNLPDFQSKSTEALFKWSSSNPPPTKKEGFLQSIHNFLSTLIVPAIRKKENGDDLYSISQFYKTKFVYIPVKENLYTKIALSDYIYRKATLGRYCLYTPGNAEISHQSQSAYDIAHHFEASGVLFNYKFYNEKGAEVQRGISKDLILRAHTLALQFIEQKLECKELILVGRSLGGGIQAESLAAHSLKPNIRYVTVSYDTFSSLKKTIQEKIFYWVGSLAAYLGWDLRTAECLKKIKAQHIVVQSIPKVEGKGVPSAKWDETGYTVSRGKFTGQAKDDQVIPAKATLAPEVEGEKFHFFGIPNRFHWEHPNPAAFGVADKAVDILEKTQNGTFQ